MRDNITKDSLNLWTETVKKFMSANPTADLNIYVSQNRICFEIEKQEEDI